MSDPEQRTRLATLEVDAASMILAEKSRVANQSSDPNDLVAMTDAMVDLIVTMMRTNTLIFQAFMQRRGLVKMVPEKVPDLPTEPESLEAINVSATVRPTKREGQPYKLSDFVTAYSNCEDPGEFFVTEYEWEDLCGHIADLMGAPEGTEFETVAFTFGAYRYFVDFEGPNVPVSVEVKKLKEIN